MKWSPSSLRLLLVASILAGAILCASALWLSMQRNAAIEGARDAAAALANSMGKETTRWISAVDKALADTQEDTVAVPTAPRDARGRRMAMPSRGKVTVESLARRRDSLANVTDLLLVDTKGQIAVASRSVAPERADLSGSEIFRHFHDIDDTELYVSHPTIDSMSGDRVVYIGRRLNADDGGWLGVVVASVPLRDLAKWYADIAPAGRSISLWLTDGVLLARFPAAGMAIGRRITDQSPWFNLVAGSGGTFEGDGEFDPEPVIGAVRPLPGSPVVIEAAISRDAALATWTRQQPWFAMGSLIAICFVFVLLRIIEAHLHRLEQSERSLSDRNAELEATRLHLNITLANVSQGVSFFDGSQRLILCNRRYAEIYGLPEIATRSGTSLAEIVAFATDAGCAMLTPHDAYPRFDPEGAGFGEPIHVIAELMSGRFISIRRQPMPDGGWVGTHEDVTEQRHHEQRTAFLAQHDVLTGLANRALFAQRLGAALAGTARSGMCAVLFLDLDRFKPVNDTLGHQVGDELLRAIATRLTSCVRTVDTVARLGGDEFAVLQDGLTGPEDAAHLAQRIIDVISQPYAIQGHDVSIGTSIGVALAPGDGDTIDVLLRNADLALYRSKSQGRGTFRFFEPGMDASAKDRLRLEQELRDAVVRNEFLLHYQPIVDLYSGKLQAFEALIRWNHPTLGLIGPDQFLTATENSGLIVTIGEWALEQACADALAWPDDIHVVLNASDAQFHRGDLGDVISRVLTTTGLPGGRLEIDINETALLRRPDQTMSVLYRLRELGVGIVLDDFGVGPSSLSGLRKFPFDKIKVDAACIRDIGGSPDVLFTVRAILRLCADLGIRTVVEGVETPEQRDLLLREHCDQAQGFLFGRPRPADQILSQPEEGGVTHLAAANATREFVRRAPKLAA